jgi:hypothetical protein
MPLTDTSIRNAKPADKPVRLFDGGGLLNGSPRYSLTAEVRSGPTGPSVESLPLYAASRCKSFDVHSPDRG